MPKVSVIIPVYGVEKFIERCSRSLFEQTLEDIELIFVDDCSPDKSIDILKRVIKEYPHRERQTKIMHHDVNEGLPVSRHTGLMEATGDYIIHCDSDDWVDIETYEVLYNKAVETNSDVVVCNIERSDGKLPLSYITGAKTEDVHQFIKDMMYMRSSWSLINKLFRKSVYAIVDQYPRYGVGEDMGLTLQIIYACNKMAYVNKPFYKYYINPNSMTHDVSEEKTLRKYKQDKDNADIINNFYAKHNECKDIVRATSFVKWSVRYMIWGLVHKPKYFRIWKTTYTGVEWLLLFNNEVDLKEKLRIVLTYLKLFPRKSDRIE